jgi:hypothetical protein
MSAPQRRADFRSAAPAWSTNVHVGPDELPQNAVLHQIEQKHLQVGSAFGLSQWIVASNGH